MSKILVTGSAGGLGTLLVKLLTNAGHTVYEYDVTKHRFLDVLEPTLYSECIEDVDDVIFMDGKLCGEITELDVLINCAGVNELNWLEDLTENQWDRVMDTNVKGIYMMSQACLPLLKKSRGTILNIGSDAAWRPMRCSLAYNASKAAVDMMTLQMARELTPKYGITVFSINPNKLAGTSMSKTVDETVCKIRGWTPEYAEQYQLSTLLTGEETPPGLVAEFITFLLQDKLHHKHLSGCIIPYGA